jgi:hypothetical protein
LHGTEGSEDDFTIFFTERISKIAFESIALIPNKRGEKQTSVM